MITVSDETFMNTDRVIFYHAMCLWYDNIIIVKWIKITLNHLFDTMISYFEISQTFFKKFNIKAVPIFGVRIRKVRGNRAI